MRAYAVHVRPDIPRRPLSSDPREWLPTDISYPPSACKGVQGLRLTTASGAWWSICPARPEDLSDSSTSGASRWRARLRRWSAGSRDQRRPWPCPRCRRAQRRLAVEGGCGCSSSARPNRSNPAQGMGPSAQLGRRSGARAPLSRCSCAAHVPLGRRWDFARAAFAQRSHAVCAPLERRSEHRAGTSRIGRVKRDDRT